MISIPVKAVGSSRDAATLPLASEACAVGTLSLCVSILSVTQLPRGSWMGRSRLGPACSLQAAVQDWAEEGPRSEPGCREKRGQLELKHWPTLSGELPSEGMPPVT